MNQATAIDFKELIQGDRAQNGKRHFKGTFIEYLELLREDPKIGELAHARLYDIVTGPGFRVLNKEDNPRIRRLFRNDVVKSYKFFEDEFFGMEKVLAKDHPVSPVRLPEGGGEPAGPLPRRAGGVGQVEPDREDQGRSRP